ncbi:MAG: glycoside hydrolase family 99-like domain-containing protein [Tepidisphaerales bacterium]
MNRTIDRRSFLRLAGASTAAAFTTGLPDSLAQAAASAEVRTAATVGAYYFDGWSGKSSRWPDDPDWQKLNPPTHLTRRMLAEFPERQPVWGWRDDGLEIMEKQIDLAADHGISFFSFCWYWDRDPQKLADQCLHTGLNLFLRARNNHRLKFCLLVANHPPFLLQGVEDWRKAAGHWMPLLTHKQHATVGGKPLLILFNPSNSSAEGIEQLQAAAKAAGLPGLAVAGCGGGDIKVGFTHRTHYNIVPGYAGGSEQHKYAELVAAHKAAWRGSREQPYMPEVTAGWDKRPWEGENGLGQRPGSYFPDRSPEQFGQFLRDAIRWMDEHPEQTTAERMVLVYAWNEFGEGGYIGPTKGDPDGAYLKAIKAAIAR